MKNSLKYLMTALIILLSTSNYAQIKNAKTETVKVYGNCGMCETKIETAGNLKKIAKVDWNKDSQMATLTYDTKKTTKDEILKRIALAGYDSDTFLAPDAVYENLHGCCQYDRVAKVSAKTVASDSEQAKQNVAENQVISAEISKLSMQDATESEQAGQTNQLTTVFDTYFAVKDALVKTDGASASANAKALLTAINSVKMEKLTMDVHMVWMKVLADLKEDVEHISGTKETKHQRNRFITLSKNIYELLKVAKTETPTYYQFCPMANGGKGANWLSKESAIKNPYFGSQMLTCGKIVETIK